MKHVFTFFVFSVSALSSWAQLSQPAATFSNHARFRILFADGGAYPASIDYELDTATFGKGAVTFGGGQQGEDGQPDFTWGQVVQFDVAPDDFAAFNAATAFSVLLQNAFTNPEANITVYASVVQLKEIPVNEAAPQTIMEDGSGSGAVNRWFQHQTPHKPGGPMTLLGSFTPTANGELTLTGNQALNTLLSGTTFDVDTTAIYLVFVNTETMIWAPPGVQAEDASKPSVFTGSRIVPAAVLP
jgi:hypothetical protein